MNSFVLKSSITRTVRYLAFSLTLVAASFTTAFSQTTTFAQYLSTFGGQDYVFTNVAGTSGTFNTVGGGAPVDFRYLNVSGLPPSLSGFQSAHVFVTTTTTQAGSGAGTVTQPLNSVITIQILRDTPAPVGTGGGTRTNLLTAVITPGAGTPSLSGAGGGNSATLSATTPAGSAHNVTFTSHFLNFSSTTDRNVGLSFSSVSPNFSLGLGSFLADMTAAGTGTFASNPVPTYIGPTAGEVSVGGRVYGPNGRALGNALVTMVELSGAVRTTRTSSFGYFMFDEIQSGQSVVLSVRSKRYQYQPQIVSLDDSALDLSFTPNE